MLKGYEIYEKHLSWFKGDNLIKKHGRAISFAFGMQSCHFIQRVWKFWSAQALFLDR